jgi:DNA-binding LytR/AlgR family response regulator
MKTAIDTSERRGCMATDYESPRLSVIVADGSPRYLDTVRKVLEFHDMVDLVGRAANFEETIQLVVTLRPDLVLMDIEMPSAMLAIAAIITTVADANIVGMFTGCIPLDAAGLVPAVNAFIDKARLRNEFLPLLQAMHRYRGASSPPGRLSNNRRLSLVAR